MDRKTAGKDREQALDLLRDPKLLDRILADCARRADRMLEPGDRSASSAAPETTINTDVHIAQIIRRASADGSPTGLLRYMGHRQSHSDFL